MIDPGKQAMATALRNMAGWYMFHAERCNRKGYHVSTGVLCAIFKAMDKVWPTYDEEYRVFVRVLNELGITK